MEFDELIAQPGHAVHDAVDSTSIESVNALPRVLDDEALAKVATGVQLCRNLTGIHVYIAVMSFVIS